MNIRKVQYTKYSCDYIIVIFYFALTILFQSDYSDKVLAKLYNNALFWNKYFELIFYGCLMMIFVIVYKKYILDCIKCLKKDYFKYVVFSIGFIILTMVTSAIILSSIGVGESNNQEIINKNMSGNALITYIVVVFIGPFVEEMVFRKSIYSIIKNSIGIQCAVIVSSLIFAIYHCKISDFLNFDVMQLLTIIPIFFMGIGLAYVQEKTSNILYPVFVHMIINFISIS